MSDKNLLGDYHFGRAQGCDFITGSCMKSDKPQTSFPHFFCETDRELGCYFDLTNIRASCESGTSASCDGFS